MTISDPNLARELALRASVVGLEGDIPDRLASWGGPQARGSAGFGRGGYAAVGDCGAGQGRVSALAIAGCIGVLLPTFRRRLNALYAAEAERQANLVETLHNMRAVKSLVLEPGRRRRIREDNLAASGMSGPSARWPGR